MKKLLALLFMAVAPSFGSVIVDSQTTNGLSFNVGKVTWNMNIGSGINRLLTIGCAYNGGGAPVLISSVTLDLSTATLVRRQATFPDNMEMWRLVSPSTGTHTINVWIPGTLGGEIICGGISFENVNISSPISTSSSSATGTVTWNVPASTTMLVDINGQSSNTQDVSPATGQTLQWRTTYTARFTSQGGSTKSGGSTAGDKTMAWTQATPGVTVAMAVNTSTSAPELTSISPNTRGIGEAAFTLTATGSNFVSGASITWNGSNRTTTFVNSTSLTAAISAADVATINTALVRVVNPDGARSLELSFAVTGDITHVWVGDGGYKPTQDETSLAQSTTTTRIWDGGTARPFQGKNEINGFFINLENNTTVNSSSVSVHYPVLTGPGGYVISSTQPTVANWHDWRNRPIQVYKAGYLKIDGLSSIWWEYYDEQQTPIRFRRACTPNLSLGSCDADTRSLPAGSGFVDRPDHDKYYPDPLIPVEAIVGSTFTIYSSSAQALWVDIYVPKDAPAGQYTGTVSIYEGTALSTAVPISLTVYPFTMPDTPPSGAFALISGTNINTRHYGDTFAAYDGANGPKTSTRLNYMRFLKRFGIMAMGDSRDGGCGSLIDTKPCPEYQAALNGTLYSPTSGYAMAPGVSTPDNFYMMFSYGQWNDAGTVWDETYDSFCSNALTWVNYFQNNFPKTEYAVYLEDEVPDLTRSNRLSTWISTCTAPANQLPTFITGDARYIQTGAPNITMFATTQATGISQASEDSQKYFATKSGKSIMYYNGTRPWSAGTGVIEFDGVDPRVASWMQYKKKYKRHFQWETIYWRDDNNTGFDTSIFTDPHTFGFTNTYTSATINGMSTQATCDYSDVAGNTYSWVASSTTGSAPNIRGYLLSLKTGTAATTVAPSTLTKIPATCGGSPCSCTGDATIVASTWTYTDHPTFGKHGFNRNNGDGVLMYPGSDVVFSSYSLHIDGPIPSWRLMMMRRGINDYTYLTLAAQHDPKAVDAIVRRIIPKVVWEYGVHDEADPTYQYTAQSWSIDPDVWERAREELANIISRHR